MAKTVSDTSRESAKAALKRRRKKARREAKLMLEIEEANRDLKKAQKKQSKAQTRLEARSATLHTLEVELEGLRTQSEEPAVRATPLSAELESRQEPSDLESSMVRPDGQQLTSSDQQDQGEKTSLTDQIIAPSHEEEVMVVTNDEVTEGSEAAGVRDNETATATEPAQTLTTPRKASAPRTATTRKPTATKRPASRSQSTKQSPSDAG